MLNFDFLKRKCKTKYFMWLADDDRLSYSAIEILYNTIKKKRDLVTIMPNWHYINSNNLKIIKKPILSGAGKMTRTFSEENHEKECDCNP